MGTIVALFGCATMLTACADLLGPTPTTTLPRDAHAKPTAREIIEHPCENGDVAGCIAACKTNDAKSCNLVGAMLEFDKDGRDDPALASGFYRRACNASYYPGCNNLAWLYVGGRGVPQDKGQAMRLFFYAYDASRVACLDGDAAGCMMAGELLEDGRGVERNDGEALAFFERACSGGDRGGCDRAEALR